MLFSRIVLFVFLFSIIFLTPIIGENVVFPIPDPIPTEKPTHQKIIIAWDLWNPIAKTIMRELHNAGIPDEDEKKKILSLLPDFPQMMKEFQTEFSQAVIQFMIKAGNVLKETNSIKLQKAGKVFFKKGYELEQKKKWLLKRETVYDGLAAGTKPELMVANWFRYVHMCPESTRKLAPLFSQNFKKRIFFQKRQKPFRNIFNELYTLFEVYYQNGIKDGYSDDKTYAQVVEIYGKLVKTPESDKCVIEEHTPRGTIRMIWILSNGAWRFDELIKDLGSGQ